ncbi:MAG: SAM-dependent methyltransferase [Clostridia bacterium]|nr:SAM-dependent methyltransferase [Clostridia bacterium]
MLTPRLQAVADLITYTDSVIDIGTDHGYLPIYLLVSGKAKTACAADIRKGPLENARENILRRGVECECVLSDGFKNICKKYSLACICGMGGETIINIITEGKDITPDTLILQPMTGADKLRKFLYENGYSITDESFVTEGEKVYCIIKAERTGENTPYTYPDLFLGKIRPKTEEFEKWKQKIRLQAEKRLLGGVNGEDKTLIALCNYER